MGPWLADFKKGWLFLRKKSKYILQGSCASCSWPWNLEVIYPSAHPGRWWPLRRVKITCVAFRRFLILETLCAA